MDLTVLPIQGSVIDSVEVGEYRDEIRFTMQDGTRWVMLHLQDCCESVYVDDICGEIQDLIGTPLLEATERSETDESASESGTWTFYHLLTARGKVVIRWYGSSNGYYSESVSFKQV